MNTDTHPLFNCIFEETHSEIKDLNHELSQLQDIYQSKINEDILLNNIDDNYFNLQQIKEFQKIFFQCPIKYSKECNIKQQQRLEKYDDDAFLTKLKQKNCCQQNCLSTKINPQTALDRFHEIKAMSQSEMNLCFLGMIDGSIKGAKSISKVPKSYLVTNYNFSEVSICQPAWLIIHEIGKTKWEALCTHYQNYGLKLKVHALTGCSFRDDTREIIFLPACESKYSLYQIYDDVENGSDHEISISSFRKIWKKYLPGIKFLTARNDLCTLCKSMRFGAKYWPAIETEQKL
ncbi:13943_t:CDS:2 [Gigaspora margarita]|uniref:13943_t:CDS:1 n=1 Tax=Gigaspora margarita TaxID=4874 RepID=A0ABN7UXH0_GIGMA|nr:13943_t:CDS:2 [Gigaspora margarita]